MIGQKFGRLTVAGRDGQHWVCDCDCGGKTRALAGNLRKGNTKSCGCLRREMGGREPVHGLWQHPAYRRWASMRARCYSPSQDSFPQYGGRGIGVCEEWRESPTAFCAWADASGFSANLQLDRIDNDGDYSPANCRWVTPSRNANNRRSSRHITLRGERLTFAEAGAKTGVKPSVAAKRLKRGWTPEEAFGLVGRAA